MNLQNDRLAAQCSSWSSYAVTAVDIAAGWRLAKESCLPTCNLTIRLTVVLSIGAVS